MRKDACCCLTSRPAASIWRISTRHSRWQGSSRCDTPAYLQSCINLNLAAQYADRLLLLHQGQVLASGPPDEVLTAGLIGAAFALPVQVTTHPTLPCPLVVAVPATTGSAARQPLVFEEAR